MGMVKATAEEWSKLGFRRYLKKTDASVEKYYLVSENGVPMAGCAVYPEHLPKKATIIGEFNEDWNENMFKQFEWKNRRRTNKNESE